MENAKRACGLLAGAAALTLAGCLGISSEGAISGTSSGVGSAASSSSGTGTGSGSGSSSSGSSSGGTGTGSSTASGVGTTAAAASGSSSGGATGSSSGTGTGSGTTGTGPDAGCTASNCEELFNCHLALEGEPREPQICGGLGGSTTSYCVEACQADSEGALLDCVATQFGAACSSPTPPSFAEVAAACGSDGGPCGANCMSCQAACQAAWLGCNFGCADAGVCLDCEYQCSQTLLGCNGLCPTD